MAEFDSWVQRCVRRINWGEFLRDAAEWLAGFCFVFGTVVLLVKLRIPQWWPHVGWLVTAVIPVTAMAWWLSRRRNVPKHAAVALLDQRLNAGGLLMTLSETNGPAWRSRLPQLESLWLNALPRLWPSRFVRVLALPIVFAVASCFVPLRNIQEPIVEGAVTQQAIDRLNELTDKLTEAQVIQEEDPESEQLIDEMKKLASENKDKPLTHEKWETVDALEAKSGYNLPGHTLKIDLARQLVQTPSGEQISFEVDAFRKHCLLNGLDDIALTLESADAIRSYEQGWRKQSPWLFNSMS